MPAGNDDEEVRVRKSPSVHSGSSEVFRGSIGLLLRAAPCPSGIPHFFPIDTLNAESF
jgi:hypothetical protein